METRGARLRESDSSIGTMEGRSLDNPKRGNPALRPGRKDRNASDCWRQGQEGRASHYESIGERTGRRSSRTGHGNVRQGRGGQQ